MISELTSGVDAVHYRNPDTGYALCGVDAYENEDEWTYVTCWECRALADEWREVNIDDMTVSWE